MSSSNAIVLYIMKNVLKNSQTFQNTNLIIEESQLENYNFMKNNEEEVENRIEIILGDDKNIMFWFCLFRKLFKCEY